VICAYGLSGNLGRLAGFFPFPNFLGIGVLFQRRKFRSFARSASISSILRALMNPANDNLDPGHHAAIVLRHILGKASPAARIRFEAGMAYARASNPAAMDATLSIAGLEAIARRILREGADLTEAGKELGPYKTDQQARAWAASKLEAALSMLMWHPQRIEKEQLLERYRVWADHQKAVKAAKAAIPYR
jgi:hypothetical protein